MKGKQYVGGCEMRFVKGKRKYYFMMTLTALFWSGAFPAGKIGIGEIPPFTLAFLRFLFAVIFMLPVIGGFRTEMRRIGRKELVTILLLGIIGMFGYHVLFFMSLEYTSAINDSIICATSPLITSVFAALFLGEYFGVKRIGSILLTVSGVLLAISDGDIEVILGTNFNNGDLIMVCAVLCQAAFSVISRTLKGRVSPVVVVYLSLFVGIIVLIPFVVVENPLNFISDVSWRGWASVLYMGLFASVIGALFQIVSINSIGASKTMIFLNLVPVFTLVFSSLIVNEQITIIKTVSVLIIIIGVYQNSLIRNPL